MTKVILTVDSFDIRHGRGVLLGIPLAEDALARDLMCANNEIDFGANGPGPGKYVLWLADLELVHKVTRHTARNVIKLDPLSVSIEEGADDPLRVRVDEHEIFRIVTMIGGEPTPNCSFLIGTADNTVTVVSDAAGQVFVLGNPTGHVIQCEPGVTLLIGTYS